MLSGSQHFSSFIFRYRSLHIPFTIPSIFLTKQTYSEPDSGYQHSSRSEHVILHGDRPSNYMGAFTPLSVDRNVTLLSEPELLFIKSVSAIL